jgi:hypothetical protein
MKLAGLWAQGLLTSKDKCYRIQIDVRQVEESIVWEAFPREETAGA